MRTLVITPPAPVVSLDEAKEHLNVLGDDEDRDLLIANYLEAATAHIDGPDGWLGRALGIQTLEAQLPVFFCEKLICPPVIDLVGVSYFGADRIMQTVPVDQFELHDRTLIPAHNVTLPTLYSGQYAQSFPLVRIQYRAGYEVLPAPIRSAILLMTGDLFNHRETAIVGTGAAQVPMSTTVENLLSTYQVYD